MLNWVLSILVHKGMVTLDEARHLAQELPKKISANDFNSSHKIVEKLLDEVEKQNKYLH